MEYRHMRIYFMDLRLEFRNMKGQVWEQINLILQDGTCLLEYIRVFLYFIFPFCRA